MEAEMPDFESMFGVRPKMAVAWEVDFSDPELKARQTALALPPGADISKNQLDVGEVARNMKLGYFKRIAKERGLRALESGKTVILPNEN